MSKKVLIKGTLILTTAGVLIKFLGFLFKIFLSRKIGSEAIGTYQQAIPVITLCHAVCISGTEVTISKLTAFYRSKDNTYAVKNAVSCTLLSVIAGILCGITIYSSAGFLAGHFLNNSECEKLLKALAFSIPFTCIHSMFYSYNLGKEKTFFPAFSQLSEQAVRFLGVIVFSQKYTGAYTAALASITGELFSVFLCLLLVVGKKLKKNYFVPSKKIYMNIIKLSGPVIFNRVLVSLLQSIESALIPMMFVLYGMSVKEALSVYGLITGMALPVVLFPVTFVNSFSMMLLPAVSKKKNSLKAVLNYSIKSFIMSFILGVLCIVFFNSAGSYIACLLFKENKMRMIIKPLSYVCPFLFINVTFKAIMNAIDKSYKILVINLFSELIMLLFIVVLVPKSGPAAYIKGVIISQITSAILSVNTIRKYTKHS